MEIIIYAVMFISGYLIGKSKKGEEDYNLYKKTNGLYEPVKRS